MGKDNLGIIIQARLGSTRLRHKAILPFYKDKGILQLMIERILEREFNLPVIVATTTNVKDEKLCDITRKIDGVITFRGEEHDVLSRFIDAAKQNSINKVIRICSDNPFLDMDALADLIFRFQKESCDYLSYSVKGSPSILTHYGFWAEAVTVEALEKVKSLTNDSLYMEHVTNYIYSHDEIFNVRFIKEERKMLNNLRMTVDTIDDFSALKTIYYELLKDGKTSFTYEDIHSYLNDHRNLLEEMKNRITSNKK